ncbi:MAG TPA: hypothetical protein VLA79_16905 [Polyangia bacterium]|nr:hypothetical protein [Polyangia bacterium]
MNRVTPPDSRLPTQLRVVGATDLERRLLDAASRELPSVELTQKMQQALGLSIAASAMTAAAVKSSGAAAAATSAPAFAWPAISVGVLALAVTGAVVGLRSTAVHHAPPKPVASVPAIVLGPAPVAPEPVAAPASAPTARVFERSASIPARAHHRPLTSATPSELRAEIALVDAARSAVGAGADGRALVLLNRYDASYRAGTFRPEATALRIEVLDHLGRTAQARTLAQRFLVAHPDSPLADRVARVTGVATR